MIIPIPIFFRQIFHKDEDEKELQEIKNKNDFEKYRLDKLQGLIKEEEELEKRLTKKQLERLYKELEKRRIICYSGRDEWIEFKLKVAKDLGLL